MMMSGLTIFFALIASFCLYFIIGEEFERQAWLKAPSTLPLYTTDEVCRCPKSGDVLNCGHCGACSNRKDIRVYNLTAQNLTNIMTWCALEGFFWGSSHTLSCLRQKSGLSHECGKCWVLNAECNQQHCKRTCFLHRVFTFLPTWKDWEDPRLDPCIACDERFCGPVFVACSGANRRRTGVVSDLQRDMGLEMCTKTNWDYVMALDDDDEEDDTDNDFTEQCQSEMQ